MDIQVQREEINVQPILVADGDKSNSPEKRTLVQSTGVRLWLRDDWFCVHTHTHTLDDTAVFSEEAVSAESAHKGYSRRGHGTNNVSMNDQLSVRMEDKTYNQN